MSSRMSRVLAAALVLASMTAPAYAYFLVDDSSRLPDGITGAPGGVASGDLPVSSSPSGEWVLYEGRPIHLQLQDWARVAGWKLEWKLPVSWIVPATVGFGPAQFMPFEDALSRVIEQLSLEGKPVRVKMWEGNRVAEVVGIDVKLEGGL